MRPSEISSEHSRNSQKGVEPVLCTSQNASSCFQHIGAVLTKVQLARQIADCGHENKSAMSRKTHVIENFAQGFIIIRRFKTLSGFGFFRRLPFSSKQYPFWCIYQRFKKLLKMARSGMSYSCISAAASKQREYRLLDRSLNWPPKICTA